MFKKVALIAFVGAVAASNGAYAGTSTSSMAVSANLSVSCTVAAAAMNFGTVSTTTATTNAPANSASVTCAAATPYTLNIDYGANASGTTRRMKNGADFLNYEVYTTGYGIDPFVQTPGTAGSPGTAGGSGTSTVSIYGQVLVQTTPTTQGSYTDTLTVAVNF